MGIMSHLDQALSLQTMRLLQEAFDGKNGVRGVMKLVLLVGMDGIKQALNTALTRVSGLTMWPFVGGAIFRAIQSVFRAIIRFIQYIRRLFVRQDHAIFSEEKVAVTTIAFKPHPSFWQQLLMLDAGSIGSIGSVGSVGSVGCIGGKVDSCDRNISQLDAAGHMMVTETWRDITLRCGEHDAHIETPVRLNFTYKGGNMIGITLSDKQVNGGEMSHVGSDWRTYGDMVPFPLFMEDLRLYFKGSNIVYDNTIDDNSEAIGLTYNGDCTLFKDLTFCPGYSVFAHLDSIPTCRSRNRRVAFNELYYILSVLGTHRLPYIVEKGGRLFGCDIPVSVVANLISFTDYSHNLFSVKAVAKFRQVDLVRQWLIKQLFPTSSPSSSPSSSSQSTSSSTSVNSSLTVCIAHPGASSTDAVNAWVTFVSDVMARKPEVAAEHSDTSVSVFVANIADKEETVTTPNPAYEEWEQRRDLMEKKGNAEGLAVFLRDPAPPKEIVTTTHVRAVKISHVNEICKPLSTLYLRRDDMSVLRASLDLFDNNRELVRRLGLPHKLGVLLHGPPGTGKSSTIAAIATYLRKDIYYLHLGCVRTNEELRLLFEHVTKNSANGGGVVVMEDVDAMTSVVHKRTEKIVDSSESSESSELTLDYFLNLLQGTLTMDGTVFIASTNHLELIDPAFYREGRFDMKMLLGACDRHQVDTTFRQFFGRAPAADVIARVRENVYTPAAVIAHFSRYVCLAGTSDVDLLGPFME